MPQWRQTLYSFPASTELLDVLIISYHSLGKLINPPKEPPTPKGKKKRKVSSRVSKRRKAINGTPKTDWDYVIFDESHHLKNYPDSIMSLEAVNVAKLNSKYIKGKSPFVIFSTATPGSSPLNFSVMSNTMAKVLSPSVTSQVYPKDWGKFLKDSRFEIKKSDKGKYSWVNLPSLKQDATRAEIMSHKRKTEEAKRLQRRDAIRIGKALIKPNSPFIRRSPSDLAGWPEQQYIPMPVELTREQYPLYKEAWSRFRKWLALPSSQKDSKSALVENLRYRQKSSLLKVDSMIDNVKDFVEAGNQVFISCFFAETIDRYKEKLSGSGLRIVEISGRNSPNNENSRIRFQKGEADVVLCTIVAGISLHAEETLPDGSKASSKPRVTIIHDLRMNPNDTLQALGRCHRDGVNSLSYFPYLEKTVEKTVIASFVNKASNMKLMTGNESDAVKEFEEIFSNSTDEDFEP